MLAVLSFLIKVVESSLSILPVIVADKPKASRVSFVIAHDSTVRDLAELFKLLSQVVIRELSFSDQCLLI